MRMHLKVNLMIRMNDKKLGFDESDNEFDEPDNDEEVLQAI